MGAKLHDGKIIVMFVIAIEFHDGNNRHDLPVYDGNNRHKQIMMTVIIVLRCLCMTVLVVI